MTLTPEVVHSKQFTTVRMRTGYDMDEVDNFLDEIELELARLIAENEDLRGRLSRAQAAALDAERRATSAGAASEPSWIEQGAGDTRVARVQPGPTFDDVEPTVTVVARAPEPAPVVEQPVEMVEPVAPVVAVNPEPTSLTVPATTSEQVKVQSFRILEMAQRTADQTVADAQEEAGRIVADAENQAAATMVARRAELADLERRLTELRNFEREYRGKLRAYIAAQLTSFDTEPDVITQMSGSVAPQAPVSVPAPAQVPVAQMAPAMEPAPAPVPGAARAALGLVNGDGPDHLE